MAIRSPLRYPGGKNKAMPLILPLIPDDIEDWREPFFGGGSVTLSFIQSNKCVAKRLIVGDLSKEIWAFWQGSKLHADEAVMVAKEWFSKHAPTQLKLSTINASYSDYENIEEQAILEGKEFWDWLTTIECESMSLAERAARTFIVNRISFSGMGDSGTLSKDQFKEFRLEHTHRIKEVSELLQRIEILNVSFEETMADLDDQKSFVFLDPPYIAQEGSGLYGKNGDTHIGFPHKALADLCKETKCKWLMTIDDSIKARRLYRGMEMRPFTLQYTMAGKTAENALAGEELFIANYDISDGASFEDIKHIV